MPSRVWGVAQDHFGELRLGEMNRSYNESRERIDKEFCLHRLLRKRSGSKVGQKLSGPVISPPAMICQVRRSRRDSVVPWPSISNAPAPSVAAIWGSWFLNGRPS